MEVTPASQYKKLHRKLVKLPSDAVFEIRKIPRRLFFELADIIPQIQKVKPNDVLTKEQTEAFQTLYNKLLTNCVTKPKIVLSNPKEDELSIDDIPLEDQMSLTTEIFNFSGLSAAAEEARKNLPQVELAK